MRTKKCPTCGETDLAKFGKDKYRPDGLATYCKACRGAQYTRTYTPTPRKPRKKRDKKLAKAKANAASRKWHQNNPDYGKTYMRQWHQNNPGYVTEQMRLWRKDHREAYNSYHRLYMARHTKPQNHK